MRTILITLNLPFAFWLAGSAWAADVTAGQAVYDKSCKTCHGSDGTPNAGVAKALNADIKDLRSAEVQGMSNDQIKKVVAEGKGKMRAVKTVAGGDLDNVAAYVHTLKK